MHHRRVASFLLGMWIAGSVLIAVFSWWHAGDAERTFMESSAGAGKVVEKLGAGAAKAYLQYGFAEANRLRIARWETAQFFVCIGLAAVLFLGTHVNRLVVVACGVMFLVIGFQHWVLTPEITYLGRTLDYVPDGPQGNRRWNMLNFVYWGVEGFKLALGIAIAAYLFVFKTRVKSLPPIEEELARVASGRS